VIVPARRAVLGLAAGLILACVDSGPATLVVDVDPLLLNGPGRVAIPARLVSARGETLEAPLIAATPSADSIVATEPGALRCLRRGDAVLALEAGKLRDSVRIQCRPVVSFAPPLATVDLEVGGAAQPIPIVGFGPDGEQVPELRFSARPADTTVARVINGEIAPVGLGSTRITLDFGGLTTAVSAYVVMPVLVDTVVLAPGEYRTWPLPLGRSRISAHAVDGSFAPTGAELQSSRANCAPDPRQRETIHCVVKEEGLVVVRAVRSLAAIIRIVQTPD
jgi:hypothetical protein